MIIADMTSSNDHPLVIFGSSEYARLARFYFEEDAGRRVVAFTVDDDYVDRSMVDDLPLLAFSETLEKFPPEVTDMHVCIGYRDMNKLREAKFSQAKAAGYHLASYICSKATIWPDLTVGENCLILENQVIQPFVKIGSNVILWSGNHIGHGTSIGNHTYLASHVVLSGHCHIGERCFFGVNSTVRDFSEIGDDCMIGMHASVVRNLEPGSVVLPASSEVIPGSERKARLLKRAYFRSAN